MRRMLRSWALSLTVLGAGLFATVTSVAASEGGALVSAIVTLSLFGIAAVLLSPLVFPRSLPAAQAQRRSAQDGRPIVYWRPGCRYCLRLRLRLGLTARRAYWVNIWQDPQGAAAVRAVAAGNETVPTVVAHAGAGIDARVNPDPAWVRDVLAGVR